MNLNTAGGAIEAEANTADPNLTITNGLTMANDSRYNVKLFGTGTADISRVNVTGATTTITTGADVRLDLSGLSVADVAVLRTDIGEFNTRTYTVLAATGSISGGGFNAANFSVSDFGNFNHTQWNFGVQTSGSNVVLTFQPVPEPATVLAVGAAGLGLAGWVRRKRRVSA